MTFNDEDIINDEIIQDFFLDRTLAKNTKSSYINLLKNYSNWRNQLPSEWVEEADIEQAKNIKLKKRKIKKDLIRYIQYLKDNNCTQNTINAYLAGIKAIYYDNDINLPKKLPTKLDKDKLIEAGEEELPTLDNIREIVSAANIRDKAIVLFQLSSGLSNIDLRRLTYKDLLNAFELPIKKPVDVKDTIENLKNKINNGNIEEMIGWWTRIRYKTNIKFYTFNSPESTKALIDYLEWRIRENKIITSNNDGLFVSNRNSFLSPDGLILIYERLCDTCGYEQKKSNNRYLVTGHQCREIFSTGLFNKKIEKLRIDFLLGHKINAQDAAYFRSNPASLYEDYVTALPEITLEKVKIKRIKSEEFKEIVRELDATKKREEQQKIENKKELKGIKESLNEKDELLNFVLEKVNKSEWIMEAIKKSPEVRKALKDAVDQGLVDHE